MAEDRPMATITVNAPTTGGIITNTATISTTSVEADNIDKTATASTTVTATPSPTPLVDS